MSTICQLHADLRYHLCMEPVDMRKQFHGLQGIINAEFGRYITQDEAFIFIGKTGTTAKILHREHGGLTLTYDAMTYLLRHYEELTAYLGIARMPIDNNDTEREIRAMVMGRKAYLYCRTEESCQRAAMMYSLLGACKVLGKDPERWLAHTLKHIGSTKTEDLHCLLPEEWTE